jgi:hypothetical protein
MIKNENDFILVLTGTLTINAIYTNHNNFELRRLEYLSALKFYTQFSKVFFLENSGYDFSLDEDFKKINNVIYYEHKKSNEYKRGKGYQEFEMIDGWFNGLNIKPYSFIKITGRYLIKNIDKIIDECKEKENKILIEKNILNKKVALTDIFYVTSDYYKDNILGQYRKCNDENGIYIEHIMKIIVDKNFGSQVFKNYPLKYGISGSTGRSLGYPFRNKMLKWIRDKLYFINTASRIF